MHGSPRVASTARAMVESTTMATTLRRPPHGQDSTLVANTRRNSSAHRTRPARAEPPGGVAQGGGSPVARAPARGAARAACWRGRTPPRNEPDGDGGAGSPRHTAHAAGPPCHWVRVCMPIHPLNGLQLRVVRTERDRHGRQWITVEHPAGCWLRLPATWTDRGAPPPPPQIGGRVVRLSITGLIRLGRAVRTMLDEKLTAQDRLRYWRQDRG